MNAEDATQFLRYLGMFLDVPTVPCWHPNRADYVTSDKREERWHKPSPFQQSMLERSSIFDWKFKHGTRYA